MNKEIKILKMITGEEVIAEILGELPAVTRVKNPLRIVVFPAQVQGQGPQVALAPWFPFTDETDFMLDNNHVIAKMKPTKQFEEQYNKTFSKLMLPTDQLILPKTRI